ncbi:MAG: sulfite exporter TauE/SafE family protein [Candidatus Sulfotelmatobacter sp.]
MLVQETAINVATASVLLIIFVATLIRSTFGFGEALVAVPLLAFFIPLEVAAPLAVLVSITIAGIVVVQDWKKIHLPSTGWLVLSTLFGIPLGLLLLTSIHQRILKGTLGLFIVAFSVYSLIGRRAIGRSPLELKRDSRGWLLVCGFCAGVLGGAYGMNGPPLAIYGAMRRWSAQHFRATLQGYFLPASIIGMAGYWLAGLWIPTVTHYYLLSLPATVIAVFLGRAINHRLHGEGFLKYIYLSLAGIGAVLSIQAIAGRR